MDTRLSKAALFVFALSTTMKGCEASIATATSVNISTLTQCVSKNSCLNGGTRNDKPDGTYRCECTSGFTGIICETEFQCVCKSSCLNGGRRIDQLNGRYRCACRNGFTGIICETDLSTTYETTTDATTEDMVTMDITTMDTTTTDLSTTTMTTTDATTEDMVTMNITTMNTTTTVSTGCIHAEKDDGNVYTGKQNWTFTKKSCQRWDSVTPHSHTYTDVDMFDGNITNVSQAENYCRNPDLKTGGSWCLTTNPQKRWEYCYIPYCRGCLDTHIGAEYTGTMNTTEYADPCLRWDAVNHSFTPANFPGGITNLSQAENHCRNPNNDTDGPWCYVLENTTAGPEPYYCNVPNCQGCWASDDNYYDGKNSITQSGLTCQRWDSQSPHPHNVTDPTRFKFMVGYNLTHVNEAENYCRSVNGVNRTKPWCFTTANDVEWEYCDIPTCP